MDTQKSAKELNLKCLYINKRFQGKAHENTASHLFMVPILLFPSK